MMRGHSRRQRESLVFSLFGSLLIGAFARADLCMLSAAQLIPNTYRGNGGDGRGRSNGRPAIVGA
jgi:hypothetical protein